MSSISNWSIFYNTLCQVEPDMVLGIDNELHSIIQENSMSKDKF